MKSYKTVDEYFLNLQNGKEILLILRDLLKTTDLVETIKWGAPAYTINGKNVIGMAAFKSYVGLWFFKGALLEDKAKVLINAQEDVTRALRQWRFASVEDRDDKLLLRYVHEAIKNQKQNKEIKPNRKKEIVIPNELQEAFENNSMLENRFNQLTPGKKREFAAYVSAAKRAETRQSRLQKVIPQIIEGIGLHDKYRK